MTISKFGFDILSVQVVKDLLKSGLVVLILTNFYKTKFDNFFNDIILR